MAKKRESNKRVNYNDIDNMTNATNAYYKSQQKTTGVKRYLIRDFWDIFHVYVIAALILIALIVGITITVSLVDGKSKDPGTGAVAVVTTEQTVAESTTAQKAEQTTQESSENVTTTTRIVTTRPEPENSESGTDTAVSEETGETTSHTGSTGLSGTTTRTTAHTTAPVQTSPNTPAVIVTTARVTTAAPGRVTTTRTTARPVTTTTTTTTAPPVVITTVAPRPVLEMTSDNYMVAKLSCFFSANNTASFRIELKNNSATTVGGVSVTFRVEDLVSVDNTISGTATKNGEYITVRYGSTIASGETVTILVYTTTNSSNPFFTLVDF